MKQTGQSYNLDAVLDLDPTLKHAVNERIERATAAERERLGCSSCSGTGRVPPQTVQARGVRFEIECSDCKGSGISARRQLENISSSFAKCDRCDDGEPQFCDSCLAKATAATREAHKPAIDLARSVCNMYEHRNDHMAGLTHEVIDLLEKYQTSTKALTEKVKL